MGKKILFNLKSICSFIFQAVLLKLLGNVPYIIRKQCYVGFLTILKTKNFMTKKKTFYDKKRKKKKHFIQIFYF